MKAVAHSLSLSRLSASLRSVSFSDLSHKCARSLREALAVPSVQRGLVGTSLISFGAFTPAFLPESNPLNNSALAQTGDTLAFVVLWTAILLTGVALLLDSWLRLRPGSLTHKVDLRSVLTLWSIPLLPVPPLFSNDAYSYAAQGWMVHLGFDPYRYGPAAVPGDFAPQVDIFWKETPAPYGPLGLQVQHAVVDLMGHSPFISAVAMRIPAVLAVIALVVVLPSLARRIGTEPQQALWLAALNPLVLMHVVGGSHNDALMVTGMAWALWAALHNRFLLATVLVGAAAAIKQPAILMVAPIASIWATSRHPEFAQPFVSWKSELKYQPRLMAYGAFVAALCVGSFVTVTAMTGLGFGWINALSVPGEVRTPLAPATMIGNTIESMVKGFGFEQAALGVFPAVRGIVGALGLATLVVLWVRFGRVRPVWFAAWALITMALTGPAVHAWYLLWGGTLLAVCRFGPTVMRTVVWSSAILVSYSAIDASFRNGALALGVTAVVAVLWLATGHDRDLNRNLDNKSQQPQPDEQELVKESPNS